jgi:hypothetical protein
MPNAWSRTWYTDVDYTLDDVSTAALMQKSILWAVKAAMKGEILNTSQPAGARWTCVGSSDAATAGMDNTDRWGTTFDATKVVGASGGSARSWIVLKSPNGIGPLYFTIHYNTDIGTNYVYYHVSKTLPTGGSTTARPTSAAELTWSGGSSQQFANTAAPGVPMRMHRVSDANGFFLLLVGKQATARFNYALGFWPLLETVSGDLNPWVCWHQYLDNAGSGPMDSNQGNWRLSASDGAMKGRLHDNTQGLPMSPLTLAPSMNAGTDMFSSGVADYVDGKYKDFEIPVWSWTTGFRTLRGVLADMRACSAVIPQASMFEVGGPLTHMLVGSTWVPFSAVPTT